MSRPISAPAHSNRRYVPPEETWASGWAPNPSRGPQPRHKIPQSSQGRGEHKHFRDTWIDQRIRAGDFVPGPGAFKSAQDFIPPPVRRSKRGTTPRAPRPQSAPVGTAQSTATSALTLKARPTLQTVSKSSTGKDRTAPRPGADCVDAKKLYLSRPSSQGFDRAKRFGRPPPSSHFTPGPGAYTQYAEFGMLPSMKPSPTTAGYLPGGKLKSTADARPTVRWGASS